ncbi:GNAT family N-acetyltransferase [Catellatospora sichuanensis]|uniref:GNAT family N-acetyltransferase n=1 Tax=Catellatospora sichuanensis TaxID=1969805 RepID=UPI0011825F9E|nr:GNAT family N-acetyltransferase [Catellatospora sichuanensis]
MTEQITVDTVVQAEELARAAADRVGVRVRELSAVAEQNAAADLLCRVWRADSPDQLVNAGMLRALEHSGNYVVGAYRGRDLIGAAVGFFGSGHLHSHIAGVDPDRQSRGVGFALKQHQRAWSLARGIGEVCWTFDPLVRRNAHVNLHKLGATAVEYLPDFYGEMNDGINTGEATDRIYVRWELLSPAASAAARGEVREVDLAALRADGAAELLGRTERDAPAPPAAPPPMDGRVLLVAVPGDVEQLRFENREVAKLWRPAVRDAICGALEAGYRITGMSRDGWYVLEDKS